MLRGNVYAVLWAHTIAKRFMFMGTHKKKCALVLESKKVYLKLKTYENDFQRSFQKLRTFGESVFILIVHVYGPQ